MATIQETLRSAVTELIRISNDINYIQRQGDQLTPQNRRRLQVHSDRLEEVASKVESTILIKSPPGE